MVARVHACGAGGAGTAADDGCHFRDGVSVQDGACVGVRAMSGERAQFVEDFGELEDGY